MLGSCCFYKKDSVHPLSCVSQVAVVKPKGLSYVRLNRFFFFFEELKKEFVY